MYTHTYIPLVCCNERILNGESNGKSNEQRKWNLRFPEDVYRDSRDSVDTDA